MIKRSYACLLTILIILIHFPAWGMENHNDVLRDQYGRAIGGATVTVYNTGTTVLATLYSDNAGTAKFNPFLTDAIDGRFNFYAPNGVYDLVFSYPGVTFDPAQTRRVTLFDPNDFSGGGGGGAGYCYRLVNATSYTVVAADTGCLLEFNGGSQINVTIPQGGTTGFGSAFRFTALNSGSFNVVFTPIVSTIQGTDNFTLSAGQSTDIASDGSNYVYTPGITQPTGWPLSSTNREITWADAFANAALFGNGSNKWALYNDPSDGLQFVGVCGGVFNACNYTRKLGSGQYLEWLNSSGVSISRISESTGAWTNFTLNTESSGNTLTIQEEVWWDVVACQGSTAQHIWNTITGAFPTETCDTGSNTQKGYAAFNDTTDKAFQMDWVLPVGFTGAIDIKFIWKAAATSGAAGWCAQLIRVPDGATSDPAFPAQASGNCVSDTAKGTTLQENLATISSVTCTSCAAGDHVYVRISRDADGSAVTDSMTGDALLMKVGRVWRVAK